MNPLLHIRKWLEQEHDRWPLWLPVAMGAGIIVYFTLTVEPPIWILGISPILMAGIWLARQQYVAQLVLSALLAFALGFNAAQIETHFAAAPMLDRETSVLPITGRLMLTEVMPEGVRLTLKEPDIGRWEKEHIPEKIRIRMDQKTLADIPPPGSRINMWAQIGPFSEPVMPGATDFRRQSYFRQLGGLGWSYSHINLVEDGPPSPWKDKFSLAFENARLTLAQHVYAQLSGDVAAMTAARLNGEQTAISKPVIEAMRIAGLAHLLSTSGFHVTIMGLLVYFPIRALLALIPWIALRYPIKKWAAFGAILSAMGYTFLVGSQAATLRSLLMTGIVMLAILVDRRAAPMRLVVLSAALVMLIAPDALLGPSFQMSFAAVLCLIAAHERKYQNIETDTLRIGMPRWAGGVERYIGAIIMTSLIATAATTPFSIYHFQSFSLYGFVANTLAIPLTSFWVMPCILMAYITAPFSLDGIFIDGAGAGISFTIKIAETVASWPYSIIYLKAMPGIALGLIVVGGLWLCLWRKKWRWLGLAPILVGGCYGFYTTYPDFMASPDGKQWAARLEDGRLAVSNLDHGDFITEQWQERLGNIETVDVRDLPDIENQLRCDKMGCVYRHGTHVLALPRLEIAALEDCEHADVVVAPYLINACAAKNVIDDRSFWNHGAHTISFDGDAMRINYSRERRGLRPWSPGYGRKKAEERDQDE